jgi:hypothetical protein
MESPGPSYSGDKCNLLTERAPGGGKLNPKIRKVLQAIYRCLVGKLACIHHMCTQFTRSKFDTEALATQLVAAISMGTPGEAFGGIKLNLEQSSKTVNRFSGLSHVVNIVKDDGPIVHVRHRSKQRIAASQPTVEQLGKDHHGDA